MVYDASRFKDYLEHEFTYDAGFRRNVGRFGRQVAIVDPAAGREWTYAELDADGDKLAAALAGLGVGVVTVLPTNCSTALNLPDFTWPPSGSAQSACR